VVKIIDKTLFTEDELDQIRRGYDNMKTLNHPNIIKLIDIFENSKFIFVVMEYAVFESLNNFILAEESLCLSEEISAKIIYQVVNGLKYLSEYGIIHRDLKPENILVDAIDSDILIKISGFELSKILSPQETTTEGFGSMVFVAPEVLLSIPYRGSVDIWSLGVMTYFIVTGTYPFYDLTHNESIISNQILYEQVKFQGQKWKEKSNEIEDFISLCLIKDKDKRINIDQVLNHKWIAES